MSEIIFLGCGKNQLRAIRSAAKAGYYTIGIDLDNENPSLFYLSECHNDSKYSLTAAKLVKKEHLDASCISFSPGLSMFVAQEVHNTIGKNALKIISDSFLWKNQLRKFGVKTPKIFKGFFIKNRDNRECGGFGIVKSTKDTFAEEAIEGVSFYHFLVVLNGTIRRSTTFRKRGKGWVACGHKLNNKEKIVSALKFKTGCLLIETIKGHVIDVGIELEPKMVEQVMTYEEVFELYA